MDYQQCQACVLCHGQSEVVRLKCSHHVCRNCLPCLVEVNSDWTDGTPPCPVCANTSERDVLQNENVTDSLRTVALDNTGHQIGELSKYCSPVHKSSSKYYCFKCRKSICEICKRSSHKNCDVRKLDDEGGSTLCEYVRDDTVGKISRFKSEVNRLFADIEPKLKSLTRNKEETMLTIADYYTEVRSKINEELRRQENELTSKMETLLDERERLISGVLSWCKGMEDELDCRSNSLNKLDINKHNVSEREIGYLQTMQETGDNIQRFEQRLSGMRVGEEVFRHVKFSIDQTAQELLLNSQLGTVSEISNTRLEPTVPLLEDTQSEIMLDPDLPSYEEAAAVYPPQTMARAHSPSSYLQDEANQQVERHVVPNYRYNWNCSLNQTQTIAMSPRIFECVLRNSIICTDHTSMFKMSISALIWIGDRLLAVDRWNQQLWLFRENGTLLASNKVEEAEPWDIVYTVYSESLRKHFCYVTVPKAKKLYCYTVENKLLLFSHYVCSTKGYISLSYDKDATRLVCGCAPPFGHPCVDIIDFQGHIFRSIVSNDRGIALFSYPRSINVADDGHIIVCDWNKKRILVLGSDGSIMTSYVGVGKNCLQNPVGTTFGCTGNILVSDSKRNAIYSVSIDGIHLGTIISDSLQEPKEISGIANHDGQFKIAVVDKGDKIKIFDIMFDVVRKEPNAPPEYEQYV